jgi:chemotaxis protein methyltransferase CheR
MKTMGATAEIRSGGYEMSDGEFMSFRKIIMDESGIDLSPAKKVMLTVRLTRRIKALGMETFAEYLRLVTSTAGKRNELPHMVDAVSTNKTDFFREPEHFNYLVRVAAPDLVSESRRRLHEGLNIWSAGCSSGEEPYTLAMVLSEYREVMPGFKYTILATDISNRVMEKARSGVYPEDAVETIPLSIRRKYLMKGKNNYAGSYRVVPELRRTISFMHHNLSEREFNLDRAIDIIFCRNVIIYFDREVQKRLFESFSMTMSPGGYLFVGHSETLDGITDRFRRVAPTIYRRL